MDIQFTASQSVDIPVAKQPVPVHHYLRQPHRLVHALAASTCIETLAADQFRLKIRPLTFMMLSIQPTVDLKVWSDTDGTVRLRSTACELRGVDYINQRFSLSLVGKLQPCDVNGVTHLQGRADLDVKVELPPALMLTPRMILETTGNGLLRSVLLTIKQRLTHRLLADYHEWAGASAAQPTSPRSAILPTS